MSNYDKSYPYLQIGYGEVENQTLDLDQQKSKNLFNPSLSCLQICAGVRL